LKGVFQGKNSHEVCSSIEKGVKGVMHIIDEVGVQDSGALVIG
jgi:hypothetical protein